MAKKVGDLLSIGLILLSIYFILSILRVSNIFLSILGFIGGVIIIITEVYFLIEKWGN